MSTAENVLESPANNCEDADLNVESFLANAWDNLSNGRFAPGLIPLDANTTGNSSSARRLQYKEGNLI